MDKDKHKIFIGAIMNLSKKSKVALFLLMITTSACFAQNWKSFVKGVEGRVGGKNNPQTKEQTKTNKTTESTDTKKMTAKLSNNPQVQKRAAYLTKAEIALNSKDYTAATENYNKAVKTKLPSNVDKSDADILKTWAAEIYARLQYQNIKTFTNR